MKLHYNIGLDTVVTQKKDIASADMDEEKVMMDLEKGKYFALNDIGSRIWELIGTPQTVGGIISKLLDEYDVDLETCRDNVLVFLNRLYYEELICIE